MRDFRLRLAGLRPVLLDGATGTELARRGVALPAPLWSAVALLEHQDTLRQIHADYVAAGAEVITANTFRTHARSLRPVGLAARAGELTAEAVRIAREAAGDAAWVAGSLAPLEDCYRPDLVPDDASLHREHAAAAAQLAAAGADLIIAETHNTVREAVAAAVAALRTGLPTLVSLVVGSDQRLLSGERIADAVAALRPLAPDALLINCGPAPVLHAAVAELRAAAPDMPLGVYANTGLHTGDGTWLDTDATDPAAYRRYADTWLALGVRLVGGCCGTTPQHIAMLKDALDATTPRPAA